MIYYILVYKKYSISHINMEDITERTEAIFSICFPTTKYNYQRALWPHVRSIKTYVLVYMNIPNSKPHV